VLLLERMSTGRLFHARGADTLNARSPNLVSCVAVMTIHLLLFSSVVFHICVRCACESSELRQLLETSFADGA